MNTCLTCTHWKSNYMTKQGFAGCTKLPIWTSTAPNSHCDKHKPADNIKERQEWSAKQGVK